MIMPYFLIYSIMRCDECLKDNDFHFNRALVYFMRVYGSFFRVYGYFIRMRGSFFHVHGYFMRMRGSFFRTHYYSFRVHGSFIRVHVRLIRVNRYAKHSLFSIKIEQGICKNDLYK